MKWVVFNQKGGVGKSTLCTNLAAVGAQQNRPSLLVDLDPQGNSTFYAGTPLNEDSLTAADMFKHVAGWFSGKQSPMDFVHPSVIDNLNVMPSAQALTDLERELESRYKMFKLRDTLKALEDTFTDIWMDTAPNFNFYTKAALIAADGFVVPVDCDDFSVQAVTRLLDNVMEIKADHNPDLIFGGIIINQFNPQANYPKTLIVNLEEQGLPLYQSRINASVKVKESHAAQSPMVVGQPKHKVSMQLHDLYNEIMANYR